jgi:hypothetical protein
MICKEFTLFLFPNRLNLTNTSKHNNSWQKEITEILALNSNYLTSLIFLLDALYSNLMELLSTISLLNLWDQSTKLEAIVK